MECSEYEGAQISVAMREGVRVVTMPRLKAACALVLHKLNASCPSSSWQLCEIMNYVLEAVSI